MPRAPEILIIAQGHAGDRLGAALAPAIQRALPGYELVGAGGAAMRAAGVRLVERTDGFSAMGWTGVLPLLPELWLRAQRCLAAWRRNLPAAVVAIDVWQPLCYFHRHLPALARVPNICYFPPGPNLIGPARVHTNAAAAFRSIVTPFPHQERLYGAAGARVRMAAHAGLQALRTQVSPLPFDEREPILALLPGSRTMEVKYGLPVQWNAARLLAASHPELRPVVCCASEAVEAAVRRRYPEAKTTRETRETLARARFTLVCSGTASLEAALLGCPGVVTYNVSQLQRWEWYTFHQPRMRRLCVAGITAPYVAMPNILAGDALYPEALDARPGELALLARERLSMDLAEHSRRVLEVADHLCWDDAGEVVAEELSAALA
jgi:lipid-A-disaccharide synthase